MATRVYRDAGVHIRQKQYECRIPGGYIEHVPQYFKDFPERIPNHSHKNTIVTCRIEIKKMVELHESGHVIFITHKEDVIEIKAVLSEYLSNIKGAVEKAKDDVKLTEHYEQALRFLKYVNKPYQKILKDEEVELDPMESLEEIMGVFL